MEQSAQLYHLARVLDRGAEVIRRLALNSISIDDLLNRIMFASTARSPVGELDDLRDTLPG